MLFLLTITVAFQLWHWRKVFWAVTGFTLGHSISLALAVFNLVAVNAAYVEFAIPVTILLSALYTAIKTRQTGEPQFSFYQFAMVCAFGIVHGLGFSNYLKILISGQKNLWLPMLSFNLGIEAGQLVVVLFILLANLLAAHFLRIKHTTWVLFCMGGATALAIQLIFETKFW